MEWVELVEWVGFGIKRILSYPSVNSEGLGTGMGGRSGMGNRDRDRLWRGKVHAI